MIHSFTSIHPEAKIGKDVTIEAFVTVSKDVVIGDGTWIGPNAVIMDGARIGNNCKIFSGAIISGVPQDLKFNGEITTAEIGDNTSVREFVTVNRGTAAKGKTVVGSNCLLQAYSHVAHDCILKDHVILGSYSGLAGEVEVDDYAIVSPYSMVHQFVCIGQHSFIGGGSKVRMDIPPYVIVANEPLSYMGVNSVGLRRRGFSNEIINEIQDVYRYIYQKGLNNSKALELIELELEPSKERDIIIDFVRNSERGILRAIKE